MWVCAGVDFSAECSKRGPVCVDAGFSVECSNCVFVWVWVFQMLVGVGDDREMPQLNESPCR